MLSRYLLVVTSIVTLASLISASLYDATANLELERYIEEVKIIHEQLIELGCQDPELARLRRELLSPTTNEVKLRMKKKLYERMIDMLVECERQQLQAKFVSTSTSPSTTATTTTPATAPTTTPTTTTQKMSATTIPQPVECQNAINLTDSWRQDHNGSNLRPTDGHLHCDPPSMSDNGYPWFRFSGAAGTHLLNRCVPSMSCGTHAALWSDHPMPSTVGVTNSILIYGSEYKVLSDSNCRLYKLRSSVMKCSEKPHDLIYRYDEKGEYARRCYLGFCGMS